jgi:ribonuclease HI
LKNILATKPKSCTRGTKSPQALLHDAVNLINGINPKYNILIFLDGSCFKETPNSPTHNAGCSAIVFFPDDDRGVETSAYLGNKDPFYAELYAVFLALEVIHNWKSVPTIPSHIQVHFITDSKDVKRILPTKIQPTKNAALVQFLRQQIAQTLEHSKVEFHWVASHINLPPHERADTLAKSAASSKGKPPIFPPIFCKKKFSKGELLSLPPSSYDLKTDKKIDIPDLTGNTAVLIAKFYTNYLIDHQCQPPIIKPSWFDPFTNFDKIPPPRWRDNNLLVTALRTPYVVTKHPKYTPLNALGWSCYRRNPKRPEFGFFSKNTPCSHIYLYVLKERDVHVLNCRLRENLHNNKRDPWRIAFVTQKKENMFLRRFENTVYTSLAWFVHNDTKYFLHLIENKLSQILDCIIYKKLKSWISQFPEHTVFIEPESPKVSRRSIQSYFHSQMPEKSTILSQPYMSYLNPPIEANATPQDPTLSLLGFHPSHIYHKSETTHTNQLLKEIYTKTCYKYEIIKANLKKNK